ncbi:Transcriptional regulator, TetR family [Neorhizobium galegae bv. officinalis]|uniref:Transcriptional regulator, TetR family n=1 Tax=Neorhizobium galegae bv. officinalis TaxID=323656 RepID=A0A0T7H258_NEOGA|nr:TetR/AcrR family transcriptional regulator [Neorhizobium galegae]CDZ40714.1 Transcriptional regulator, TetR family [Neorhizobium galegae bv. officinalis]CDZ53624.1 Transcriptional regulator, TetR family [Neorhizobium galegae bv. officinalis]
MGARHTVDKDRVIALAEGIVSERGAAALTIDAVAKAAGITKGGVQSSFGTKDALIAAMLDKWMSEDDRRFRDYLGDGPASPARKVAAHVKVTHQQDEATHSRAVSLLVSLLQSTEHLESARRWYARRIDGLQDDNENDERALLAFLAAEGAFFLKFLKLIDIDQDRWDRIFTLIDKLLVHGEGDV